MICFFAGDPQNALNVPIRPVSSLPVSQNGDTKFSIGHGYDYEDWHTSGNQVSHDPCLPLQSPKIQWITFVTEFGYAMLIGGSKNGYRTDEVMALNVTGKTYSNCKFPEIVQGGLLFYFFSLEKHLGR